MPRWPPPPLRQRRPLLRKPAAHEATAAAAANKQHALDAWAPSEKSDLPREPGDGVEIMDDEGFSWGRGGGGTARRRRAEAPRLLPRLATSCGEAILTALGPRPSHARVHGEYLGLYIRSRVCVNRDICLVF